MKGEGFDEGSKQKKKILHEQGSLPNSPALLMDRMKTEKEAETPNSHYREKRGKQERSPEESNIHTEINI